MIADLGLNVVRVPFNHTVLEEEGRTIDYSAPGWTYLDRLLDWCERHGVYAVLDLHSVPGGQSGMFVADPDPIHVWKSEKDLQRTVDLWVAIASRYRDRTIVAGYDLINEPDPPTGAALVSLYRRILEAIRAVDPHHLVLLEGGGPASSDFSFYEGPLDPNQAYSFHTYNLFTNALGKSHLQKLAAMAEKHDVPLRNGEFGAHTDEWVRQEIELFEGPAGAGAPSSRRLHRGEPGREARRRRRDGRHAPELAATGRRHSVFGADRSTGGRNCAEGQVGRVVRG